jgi:hypothetical protein
MVVLLLNKLGGTNFEDRGDKTHISEEESQTWEAILNSYINNAELSFRVLQSNNVFTNGPNIVVDEFTNSSGTKNTVNIGSSTCRYDSINDYYTLGISDESSGDTTHDPNSFTNPGNAFDGDDSTAATRITSGSSTVVLGKTFTSKLVNNVYVKFGAGSTTANNLIIKLETFNGTTWNTDTTFIDTDPSSAFLYETILSINDTVQGVRISMFADDDIAFSLYTLEYGDYDSSSTLIADTGTTTLDDNELGFAISNPDATIPTNTGITATISDGTNSLTPVTIDSVSKGAVVGNPATLIGGTLKCTFTLSSTDTTITPTINGYGISIIRE